MHNPCKRLLYRRARYGPKRISNSGIVLKLESPNPPSTIDRDLVQMKVISFLSSYSTAKHVSKADSTPTLKNSHSTHRTNRMNEKLILTHRTASSCVIALQSRTFTDCLQLECPIGN
jgi:hypothetical protein